MGLASQLSGPSPDRNPVTQSGILATCVAKYEILSLLKQEGWRSCCKVCSAQLVSGQCCSTFPYALTLYPIQGERRVVQG